MDTMDFNKHDIDIFIKIVDIWNQNIFVSIMIKVTIRKQMSGMILCLHTVGKLPVVLEFFSFIFSMKMPPK